MGSYEDAISVLEAELAAVEQVLRTDPPADAAMGNY
jgi:hypothetical protein